MHGQTNISLYTFYAYEGDTNSVEQRHFVEDDILAAGQGNFLTLTEYGAHYRV